MEVEIYCVYCEVGNEARYNSVEFHTTNCRSRVLADCGAERNRRVRSPLGV